MAFSRRDVENVVRTVFRRCVQCPATIPSCPTCPSGQMCIQQPATCDACTSNVCVPNDYDPTNSSRHKKGGPNAGAIAGGVIGGLVALAIVIFLFWHFCLKGRRERRRAAEAEWMPPDVMVEEEKPPSEFGSRRSARTSTHTVGSMASTAMTRASNVIQIAYIPGVTNRRSGPGSPDLLVPPVPPIPIATTNSTATTPFSPNEQHFFMPGDLRGSTFSGATERTSIAPSLARTSIASSYHKNVIINPAPTSGVVKGKASVVHVKSGGADSPADSISFDAPPVPAIDPKHVDGVKQVKVATATTLGPVRALNITKKKASVEELSPDVIGAAKAGGLRPVTQASAVSTDDGRHWRAQRVLDDDSDPDSDGEDHRPSLLHIAPGESTRADVDRDSPFNDYSPSVYSMATAERQTLAMKLQSPLAPLVEEDGEPSAKGKSKGKDQKKRTQSPFDDENEV